MISCARKSISWGSRPVVAFQRGFTLVEIMMSVVLLGIGLALALPSYRDMVEKRQVTNGAEQLASFINTAQGVAMKTNSRVIISYDATAGDNWCVGATNGSTKCVCTVTDPSAEDYCQIATQPFVLNASQTGGLDLMHDIDGESDYAFDPIRGLLMEYDPDTDVLTPMGNSQLTVKMRSPSEDFRLNLVINNTGRMLLCSDDSEHSIPGYAVCPAEAEESEES